MTDKPTIRVVFRADASGEVTAVFDDREMDGAPGTWAVCYAHIGQHSDCAREWYHTTRAAKPREYAPLLAELRQIYSDCNLVVGRRVTHR